MAAGSKKANFELESQVVIARSASIDPSVSRFIIPVRFAVVTSRETGYLLQSPK